MINEDSNDVLILDEHPAEKVTAPTIVGNGLFGGDVLPSELDSLADIQLLHDLYGPGELTLAPVLSARINTFGACRPHGDPVHSASLHGVQPPLGQRGDSGKRAVYPPPPKSHCVQRVPLVLLQRGIREGRGRKRDVLPLVRTGWEGPVLLKVRLRILSGGCMNELCGGVIYSIFFQKCIRHNKGKKGLEAVKNSDDWLCFACDGDQITNLRIQCRALYDFLVQEKRLVLKVNTREINDSQNYCILQTRHIPV